MIERILVLILLYSFTLPSLAAGPFEGKWEHLEKSGWQFSATLALQQTGDHVHGIWSYGCARDGCRGTQGELDGKIEKRILIAKRCYEEGSGYGDEQPQCPRLETADSYISRIGTQLRWCTVLPRRKQSCHMLKPVSDVK